MNGTIVKSDTKIDRLIFGIVAKKNGGSSLYDEIMDDLSDRLTPTKLKRIINGSSTPSVEEVKLIAFALRKHDDSVSIESIV